VPKPMVPLGNKPIMEHTVELLRVHGFDEILVLLYFLPEVITEHFGDGSRWGVRIAYVTPAADLGTAGAVKFAAESLGEPVLVISGDIVTDFDLGIAVGFHEKAKAEATMVLTRVENPLAYGIVITDETGRVTRFLEKPTWGEVFSDTINTGIYLLEPSVFAAIPAGREYDFGRDLTAVARLAGYQSAIVVHPSLPVKSVKELIALARARPGELNFGSPSPGSPNRLAMELFMIMAKVKMTNIPYKGGSGQMVTDLVAGQVQLASMGLPPSIAYIKAGRLRALAVTSEKRAALLPDLPTVSEAGLPGFNVTSWFGVFAPAGLPKNIVAKVNGDVTALLGLPDVKERLERIGAEPAPQSAEEFARFVRDEIARWGKVVKASGAKVD